MPAVEWLAGNYQDQFKLKIAVESKLRRIPLTEDVRVMLYRSVRELLMNVGKHSKATSAQVRFSTDSETLSIAVEDDGIGFDPDQLTAGRSGGFGLFSLRERLRDLGVQFVLASSKGKGTRALLRAALARPIECGEGLR